MDKLTVYLRGKDKGIDVDLHGRSSHEEWQELAASGGRWSKLWVPVKTEGTRTTYVRPDAIVMAEVDYTPPPSADVAEKLALEDTKATERKKWGHDEPRYTD